MPTRRQSQNQSAASASAGTSPLSSSLEENMNRIRHDFGGSSDLTIRTIKLAGADLQIGAVYIDGIVDKALADSFVSHLTSFNSSTESGDGMPAAGLFLSFAQEKAISMSKQIEFKDWDSLYNALLSGCTVVVIDGLDRGIGAEMSGGETRPISEAATQVSIRGSKESFSETIGTNIALVRRRIKSRDLWTESFQIGRVTQTTVTMMYVHSLADENKINELRKRLQEIRIDSILESGYIEQLIEQKKYTPFPTLYNTERPDSVAGNLLDGRIAVFVDGTPFVLIAPSSFFMFLHTVEDYYQRFDFSTLIRILRLICLIISMFGPALFVAALNFHQEMIPTPLLINLASQREGVPFPTFIEALLMEVTFEIIREAGIRLPSTIGQTVSIIGGLVLGQAAVEAGIVSPAMVIVVSLTGISSFAMPAFNMALSIRMLRFVIIFMAAFMGLYGITIMALILTAHLCSLNSLGTPFMSPFAPFIAKDQKDTIFRTPLYFMRNSRRTKSISNPERSGGNSSSEN